MKIFLNALNSAPNYDIMCFGNFFEGIELRL